ncbi:MAG TPA: hypothetical protein DCM49_00030 [Lachnospiraceae bacterium]|nr:hypothetical protein [Lachnospiraceae bacterium]
MPGRDPEREAEVRFCLKRCGIEETAIKTEQISKAPDQSIRGCLFEARKAAVRRRAKSGSLPS